MAQAPFFTGRDSHFNAKSGVESRTPTIFGSLVDIYGTGFYLRPDSGTNVFRNSNMPTTGLICGASGDDIVRSCARIIQDTLDDNNSEASIRSRVLVLHSGYGSISKPSPFSCPSSGMPQIKPHIYVPPLSLDHIRDLYSNTVSVDYARTSIHPLVIHADDVSLRHLLAMLNPNGPPDSIWNLGFNRKLMQIVLSLPVNARYVDYTRAIVEFASWDSSEKEFLFARFKLFETFLGDETLSRNLHSQPFLVVDLSHYLIQNAKIDLVVLDVVLNLFLSYRADQRLVVCSGQHNYLSSDNIFKSTLWSMIESPFDSRTHLFFASQNPALIPPDILSLLNCVVCHRFGSAAWAVHLHSHFAHSAVPLEDYAPKLGSGEVLLFAPDGASSDDGTLRRWNGGCIRLKVAAVETREPDTPQEAENTASLMSRPSITAPLDAWVAANGTPVLQLNLIPQSQPAPLRRTVTPQRSLSFKSPPLTFRHFADDLKDTPAKVTASRGSSLHQTTPAMAYQHPVSSSNLVEQLPRMLEFPGPHPSAPPFPHDTVPFIMGGQNGTAAPASLATVSIPAVSSQPNATPSAAKTLNFEPFIAAIKRARRSDEKHISRTEIGAHLSKADYEAFGLIGLKQLVQAAVIAGVIVTGGSEHNPWIGLPEWFSPRFDGGPATLKPTEPAAFNRPPGDIFAPLISVLNYTHDHLKYDHPLVDKFVPALGKRYPDYLVNANCRSFFEYASLAEMEGIIVRGGTLEKAWIALKREGVELASLPMPTSKSPPGSVFVSRVPLPTSQPSMSTVTNHASDPAVDQARQRFAPLIDAINRTRKDEAPSVLWSKLGEMLKKADYVNMGVSGLKVCITEAEKMGIIETGKGEGLGQEWVALPEWSAKRLANIHAAIMKSRSSSPTPAIPTLTFSPNSAIPIVAPASSTPSGSSQPVASSSASLSTRFAPLIAAMEQCRQGDAESVKCSLVGMNLTKEDYTLMGVIKWSQSLEAAEKDGLIVRGGIGGDAWVALKSWKPDPLTVPAAFFSPLVQVLKTFKQSRSITDPYCKVVAKVVLKINANAFQQAGVASFEEYAAIAEKQGFVTIEGKGASAKIRLKE